MKVLIAAHYNLNNGDRALLEATIQIVRKMLPNSEITVSAYVPEKIQDPRFSVVGWALGNGKKESLKLKLSSIGLFRTMFRKHYELLCNREYLRAVEESDLVLISGGHHLTDILSNRGYYKLSANFYIPIALKKKTVLLPQSIGPAHNKGIITSIKYILQNSYSVAYRDKSSEQFIKSLNIDIDSRYVPDLVYSLQPFDNCSRDLKTVGIALYHSYAGENREKILPFTIKNLTLEIDDLLSKGYSVKIIPMDSGDEEYSKKIYETLKSDVKKDGFVIADRGSQIMDIVNQFATVSFCLAYKTHSTVFSMICNTPLVAVAYHPKSTEFMKKVGLQDYAINDTDASYENLRKAVSKIEANYDSIREKETLGVSLNRDEINTYLQEMLQ